MPAAFEIIAILHYLVEALIVVWEMLQCDCQPSS